MTSETQLFKIIFKHLIEFSLNGTDILSLNILIVTLPSWRCGSMLASYTRDKWFGYTLCKKYSSNFVDSVDSLELI